MEQLLGKAIATAKAAVCAVAIAPYLMCAYGRGGR